MNERSLLVLGGMIGAIVGVGVGFALFTERGRRLRAELQPEIEAVMREGVRLKQVVHDVKAGRTPAPSSAASASAWPRRTV